MASVLWLLVAALASAEGSKILLVFPFPSASHKNLAEGFVRHLTAAGHEVTYITPYPIKNPHPSLYQVPVRDDTFPNQAASQVLRTQSANMLNDLSLIYKIMMNVSKATVQNENVRNLLYDPAQHFDIVIAEWMYNDVYAGFATVFNCPLTWFFPFDQYYHLLSLIDEHPNPAYSPSYISGIANLPLTFTQRVKELVGYIMDTAEEEFYYFNIVKKAYEELFGPIVDKKGRQLPPFEEVKYNVSFIFGNTHVSLSEAKKYPPNYLGIGGFHIQEPEPLPEDLKNFMDNQKNGVIYFSMGSLLKCSALPDSVQRELLNMFAGLNYTVLWKFEKVLPDLPKNVRMIPWAPQTSILAHPNCKLFISHGGFLSSTEATHFGIPIIGIPVFADQFLNVDRLVNKGCAKRVDFSHTMAGKLGQTINEILSDTRYVENVKKLSFIYHHRPIPPGAELVHWVEHVVKTRGALHLRSPALMLPWYQKMYLDLAVLIILALILFSYVFKRVCNFGNSNNKVKKS